MIRLVVHVNPGKDALKATITHTGMVEGPFRGTNLRPYPRTRHLPMRSTGAHSWYMATTPGNCGGHRSPVGTQIITYNHNRLASIYKENYVKLPKHSRRPQRACRYCHAQSPQRTQRPQPPTCERTRRRPGGLR